MIETKNAKKCIGRTVYNTAICLYGEITSVDEKNKGIEVLYENNKIPVLTSCNDLIFSTNKKAKS